MKNFIVYNQLGKILRYGTCEDSLFELQAHADEFVLEGTLQADNSYIDGENIVEMPNKPNGFYDFDYKTKQWVLNYDASVEDALHKRNILLAEGPDRISPVWWSSMTEKEQQAWTFYRQALLDITEQADYPEFIVWPIKP